MQLNPFHRNFGKSFWHSFYTNKTIAKIRYAITRPSKNVLIYVGVNFGHSLDSIFTNYKTVYGFEADPQLFAKLQIRYQNYPHIKLYNYAVTNYDGELEFNVCTDPDSVGMNSIGKFSRRAKQILADKKLGAEVKTITIPCINLGNFLTQHGVAEIDDYISDIQGYDLQALATMKSYIDNGKIKTIQSEVCTDSPAYTDTPDNSETGFNNLLEDKYKLIAKGMFEVGKFRNIPTNAFDYDCKWELK